VRNHVCFTMSMNVQEPVMAYDNADDFILESINECRGLIGCSRTTLYKLIRSGELRTVRVCGRQKVPRGERLRFVRDQLEHATA